MTAPDRIADPFSRRPSWAEWWPVSRREFRDSLAGIWDYVATAYTYLEERMAADRELLASIATDLTALAVPITDLIASEAALRARVAELEGEAAADEAGDLEAARQVKAAFDGIADKFRAEPETPDVEPLPEPAPDEGEQPA